MILKYWLINVVRVLIGISNKYDNVHNIGANVTV